MIIAYLTKKKNSTYSDKGGELKIRIFANGKENKSREVYEKNRPQGYCAALGLPKAAFVSALSKQKLRFTEKLALQTAL